MNTAQLDSPSIQPSPTDSSTEDPQQPRGISLAPVTPSAPSADTQQTNEDSAIVRLVRTHERTPIATKPHEAAKAGATPLPIAVLTNDSAFAAQMRAALDGTPTVTYISSIDEAVTLAADGRCSILVTDLAMTRTVLDAFANRLRARNPAVVLVIAGDRDRGSTFINLQSAGIVDGFLLKPITVGATQLVMAAAVRRYQTHRTSGATRRVRIRHRHESKRPLVVADDFESGDTVEVRGKSLSRSDTPGPAATPSRSRLRHPWLLLGIAAIAYAIAVWFGLPQRSSGIDPAAIVAKHLALAEGALSTGRLLDPRDGAVHHFQTVLAVDPQNFAAQRGLEAVARALSKETQAHMTQQRFADAAVSLARLRELQPDYPELPLLESQLKVLQDALVATHAAQETPAPASDIQTEAPRERAASQATSRAPTKPQDARNSEPRPSVDRAKSDAARIEDNMSFRELTRPAEASTTQTSEALTASIAPLPTTRPSDVATTDPELTATPSLPSSSSSPSPSPSPKESQATPPSAPTLPALVKYVPPHYPSDAYARQMEGWVEISLAIAPNGDVIEPRVEAGEKRQLFARSALAAVRQWKYEPDARRSPGQRATVRVDFKLQ